jgi:D-arabinose 1-dehydrogenase-like Zn-dependent alcohol dehydrogenase
VVTAVGRVHYGGIRITGTAGSNVADALAAIPATAEIRPNDKINIIGAAGPMGTMHVIRDLCQGVPNVTIFAGDLSDERLGALRKLSEPLAQKNKLTLKTYNPSKDKLTEKFNYIVLMAPVPALVAQAVKDAEPRAIINIFAGIPADKTGEIDLDAYIEKQCYFIGTSGSTLDDLKAVLKKVESRQLDTNLSVAAIAGLDGAVDGIRAVERNTMPGKIIVYPFAKGLKLTALTEAGKEHPGVAKSLNDGQWNKNAEEALKKEFGAQ